MAEPDGYTPQYDFSNYQAANPSRPLPGHELDVELSNVSNAIDSTQTALTDIRRSDGQLKNGIVTADSLSLNALAALGPNGDLTVAALAAAEAAAATAVAAESSAEASATAAAASEVAAAASESAAELAAELLTTAASRERQTFTTVDGVFEYALDFDPTAATLVLVTINGVVQSPGDHFTLTPMPSAPSGRGITFSGSVILAGDRVDVVFDMPLTYDPAVNTAQDYASRAAFVEAVANGLTMADGHTVTAGGADYIAQTGATIIPDLPGFYPIGPFTPLHFGAVGDGVTDDGAKINIALAAFKVAVEAVPNLLGGIVFSGLGRQYRSTVSVNLTGITAWGWAVQDITIRSEAMGKTAVDMIGSRGGRLTGVMVYGHPASTPRVGIQTARAAAGGQEGFADILHWQKVNTRGQFSLSGVYIYGTESSVFDKCEWWNENPDAHSALILGYDKYPVQSDYLPAITGETSFINNTYTNCELRHLPSTGYATVTGVTLSNPLVVQVNTSVLFSVGQTVVIGEQLGTPEMYNLKAVITDITGNNITFGSVDATGWSAYVSGGVMARAQSVATAVIGRMRGHAFRDCYVVNYGSDGIEVAMTPSLPVESVIFENVLFEGYGTRSQMRFMAGSAIRVLKNFKFTSWGARTATSVFSTDANGSGRIDIISSQISVPSANTPTTPKIFDTEAKYTLYGVDMTAYSGDAISPESFPFFGGRLIIANTGVTYTYGSNIVGNPRKSPIIGTTINDNFEDGAGAISAFKRYDSSTDSFSWSLDGTNLDYIMVGVGLYPASDDTKQLGLITRRWAQNFSREFRPGTSAAPPTWTSGVGSPEGVLRAVIGSMYTREDGGAGTTLYVKESGTGNTGWVAK